MLRFPEQAFPSLFQDIFKNQTSNMKNRLLFLCFLTMSGLNLPSHAEDVPSLVVHHYYGNDSYPVSLEDYNKIKIGENSYTLQSPSGKPDITLSYNTYPRFSVENVSSDDIVTSQQQVAYDHTEAVLIYCAVTQSLLATTSDGDFAVAVFNAAGQRMLSGSLGDGRELSVASLPAGIYFAVAADDSNITLKFAKH